MEQGYFSLRKELSPSSSLQSRTDQALRPAQQQRSVVFSGEWESSSVLPGKKVLHRVAEFRGSVAMWRANGSFKACAASQCLGRPELSTSHLTNAFATPFLEPAAPEEPCVLQGGCTSRKLGPSVWVVPGKPLQPC